MSDNPEKAALLRAIDDHIKQVAEMENPNKKRIEHIEGMIRSKRRRIDEIESE